MQEYIIKSECGSSACSSLLPEGWGAHTGQAGMALLQDMAGCCPRQWVCARESTHFPLIPRVAFKSSLQIVKLPQETELNKEPIIKMVITPNRPAEPWILSPKGTIRAPGHECKLPQLHHSVLNRNLCLTAVCLPENHQDKENPQWFLTFYTDAILTQVYY